MLDRSRQQLDETTERLQEYLQHILSLRSERLQGMALRLHSLSPLLTIARGYAVVRRDIDAVVVTSTQQVQAGDAITIQVTDGHIHASVQ